MCRMIEHITVTLWLLGNSISGVAITTKRQTPWMQRVRFSDVKLLVVSIWKWNRATSNLIRTKCRYADTPGIGMTSIRPLRNRTFFYYECKRKLTNQELKAANTSLSGRRANCEIRRLDKRYLLMTINANRNGRTGTKHFVKLVGRKSAQRENYFLNNERNILFRLTEHCNRTFDFVYSIV